LKQELDIEDCRISSWLPVKTRWGTYLKTYETLQQRKNDFLAVMNNTEAQSFISTDLRTIITSPQFWTSLEELIQVIKPLVLCVTTLEGNKSSCNVLKEWTKLENTFIPTGISSLIPIQTKSYVHSRLQYRWKFIADTLHFTTFALDPNSRDFNLNTSQHRTAEETLTKVAQQDISTEFAKFRRKQFPYEKSFPVEGDPIEYWNQLCCIQESTTLAKAAYWLMTIPQSTASVERSFSAVRRIHTWTRSSLGREKLAKLVYIYFNCSALRKAGKLK